MGKKRIYDPEIEEQAREFPRFDFSDAEGTRAVRLLSNFDNDL